MTIAVDVSGIIEILLHKEKADKYEKVLLESTLTIAPDLYVSELINTLWKYYAVKKLSRDDCMKYMQKGINLVDVFINSMEIWEEAFSEGIKNNHSIYDMFYMVSARRNGGILITNDFDLAGICKKNHVQICY